MISDQDDRPDAIVRLLAEKPDRNALSQAVRARFGQETFYAQVGMTLGRLVQTT